MALTALSPPASGLLLDPAALRIRLAGAGIKVSTDDAASLAAAATAEVSAVLGYDPAYQAWRQTFGSTVSPYLYLTPRPVRSLTAVTGGAGTALGATTYRFEGQRLARESRGWQTSGVWPLSPVIWPASFFGDDVSIPDWSAEFFAGWWLPLMGANTESIPTLDPSIAEYAYQVAKVTQLGSEEVGLGTVEIRGVKMTDAAKRPSGGAGYVVDPPLGVLRWRAPLI